MTLPGGSQSVDRALALLAQVGRLAVHGAPLTALVEGSGLNKPTVRRLLLALIRAGLVEQDATTRRYFLGEQAYILGTLATPRFGLLEIAMESLLRLSQRTQDASFLSVRRGNVSVCLHREEGTFPIRTHALQTGQEHPLGIGAGSLAILAELEDAEVEAVLAANESLLAPYPALDAAILRAAVAQARAQGYALNPGLILAGSWGMGVAVRHPDGRVIGALSVAAIESRMQPPRQKEIAALLHEEAERVEKRLGGAAPAQRLIGRRN